MTLRFASVSLGVDLQVYRRNYTVSYKREEVLRGKKRMSRPPSAICPPPLPPASSHPHISCAVEWGGVWIKEALLLLTSPSKKQETLRGWVGVGRKSSSYFAGAVV